MVVSIIYKFSQLGKIEKPILSGLDRGTVRPIPLWARASFENPIEAH
jgi:hypothetical protein